jgi:hypothetical protein
MTDLPAQTTEKKESPFRKFKHALKRKFLRAFAQIGMVGKAADAAGIDRDYHYYWLKSDESHVQAFDHPVIYEGKITDSYKAYSDNLAMFFLKGLRPDRYRDNQAGITLQGPTQINIVIKDESQKNLPDE